MSDESQNGVQPTEQVEGNETLENEVEFSEEERGAWDDDFSKKVESLSAQKKHFRTKYEKAAQERDAALKELEQFRGSNEPKEKPKATKADVNAELLERVERAELRLAHPDLTQEQISKAMKWAAAEGVDTSTFIQSPEFQAILGAQKEQQAAESSTPNPSSRSGSGAVDFSQVTPDQIASMDDASYEKYQKWMKEQSGGNTSGLKIRHRTGL